MAAGYWETWLDHGEHSTVGFNYDKKALGDGKQGTNLVSHIRTIILNHYEIVGNKSRSRGTN